MVRPAPSVTLAIGPRPVDGLDCRTCHYVSARVFGCSKQTRCISGCRKCIDPVGVVLLLQDRAVGRGELPRPEVFGNRSMRTASL